MVPAPAQGIIGLDCRADDHHTRFLLESICHTPSKTAALMERAFLQSQGGGCSAPIGAYATRQSGRWRLATSVEGTQNYSVHFPS
jgi:hydroxymethylbilane synthase